MADANAKFLDTVNQTLHTAGVLFEKRIDIILELLHGTFKTTPVALQQPLLDILAPVSVSNEELFQKVFMFYGSKYLKKEFDQFYTPLTIGEFLCDLCEPQKTMIDPACGTGDLVIQYNGALSLWDISPDVTSLTTQNYAFQAKAATIETRDSLRDTTTARFDYAIVNPPFGTKTLLTETATLETYVLGRGKAKQELGILFVEKSLNLLKEGGILSIILPNGYVGNAKAMYVELRRFILQHRVLGVIKLPQNTFKRSGTGVSTSILIVKKTPPPPTYDIFIEEVANIGYELNKKNTPYKYRNGVLHNDLRGTLERFRTFARTHGIDGVSRPETADSSYQSFNTSQLDAQCMLDISRYLSAYTGIVSNASGKVRIRDLLEPSYTCTFQKTATTEYLYLDIKGISTPLHSGKPLLGKDLPSRAKYSVKQNDILVSRLKGTVAFTVILEPVETLVCTNGVCVLRPKDTEAMQTLFAGLFSSEFKIQHAALTTGSIMESLTDDDLKNIVISSAFDVERYQRILESVRVLQTELPLNH